jgi:hypothetical protein
LDCNGALPVSWLLQSIGPSSVYPVFLFVLLFYLLFLEAFHNAIPIQRVVDGGQYL